MPDTSLCANNWRLYHRDCYPRFLRKNVLGGNGLCGADLAANREHGGHGRLRQKLPQQLNAFLDLLPYQVEPNLINWLDEFQPQLVYSCFSSLRITQLVEYVSRRYNAPIVPHIMDDWWTVPYHGAWGSSLIGPWLRHSFRRILPKTPMILTIGKDMSQEFSRRFGLPCHDYMNCLEDKWIDTWGKDLEPVDGLKVAVLGNMDHGRASLLKDLSEAMVTAAESLKVRSVAMNVTRIPIWRTYRKLLLACISFRFDQHQKTKQ